MVRPTVQAGLAVYVSYWTVLRHAVNPQGNGWLLDAFAVLYLGYWLLGAPKLPFALRYAILWLALPALYLAYLFLRGAVSLSDGAMLILGCYLMGLGVIRVSRWLSPADAPDLPCCH